MKAFLIVAAIAVLVSPVFAAQTKLEDSSRVFLDVPENHWAAASVKQLTLKGVFQGYPDSKFKGDQPVTRYELAVALARLVEFIEPSLSESKDNKVSLASKSPSWAQDSLKLLASNDFLPKDSPILTDGSKLATQEDLAQALASVAARVIELKIVDPGPQEIE